MKNTYLTCLEIISGIKLTRREIDIVACLLNGRSPKVIASLLSISPRTIETHTRSIMLKLDCHSREGIINFLEKTDKVLMFREHYLILLSDFKFKQKLQEIAKLPLHPHPTISLVFKQEEVSSFSLVKKLEKHLRIAGVKVLLIPWRKDDFPKPPLNEEEPPPFNYFVLVASNNFIEQIHAAGKKGQENFFLCLLMDDERGEPFPGALNNIDYINFSERGNYYLNVLEILRKIISSPPLEKLILQFKEQYLAIQGTQTASLDGHNMEEKEKFSQAKGEGRLLTNSRNFFLVGTVLLLFTLVLGVAIFKGDKTAQFNFVASTPSIRSDLFIPPESTLLPRPHLLSQIEEKLSGDQEIKAIALVGIGGAGKTTLARQYARTQQASVAWEINAETKQSLITSFESLAHALCKEEEKKILGEIQDIKNLSEREEKLLLFVKEKLRNHNNWILIYNDLNNFTQIKNYIPQDKNPWGEGRVILTTRDSNINSYIQSTIQIGELTAHEKLTLFTQIMNKGESPQLSLYHEDQTELFLSNLPPFPLDILLAAYYLKTTHTSYEKYLEYLKHYDGDFALVQESILKGTNNYSRTRYSVIALSLKSLLETNKDFEELLLFISLLNSQDIPRALLDLHKGEVVVDSFIYNLKKYSWLVHSSSKFLYPIATLSTHKSTQEISLTCFMKSPDREQKNHYLQNISKTLEEYVAAVISKEDFSRMKMLAGHCEMFLSQPVLENEQVKGMVGGRLGVIYFYLGDYAKSQKVLEESLGNLDKEFSDNHFRVSSILTHLGMVYRKLGNYEKAKDLLEEGIRNYRTYCPKNYVEIARSLRYLGMVHKSLGNYEKSKELFEESLVIYKTHPSEKMQGFSWSLGSLGVVYRKLGHYEQAKKLLEQSLTIYRNNLPENHGGLAWTLAHLGRVYICLGDYEKAKELFEESLMIYKTHLSENNVRVSWVLAPLGIVYRELGDYKKAQKLIEQSLEIYGSKLPPDHLSVAWTTAHLGVVHKSLGNYEKAKGLLEQSLRNYEKHYGSNHLENARILMELGKVYLMEGNLEVAQELITKSLNLFSQNKHPEAYIALECLADIYTHKLSLALNSGDVKQSITLKKSVTESLDQAFNIVKNHFPPNSPHIFRIRSKMGTDKLPHTR